MTEPNTYLESVMQDGQSICRWGILGTAGIAPKYVNAMQHAGNAMPCSIGSRTLESAEAFKAEHGLERAYGSYEAVLEDPEITAVYIPLPTTMHREWTIRCAEAGKHVLCEKPVGRDMAEVESMVAACADHGVQFMDGVMFMHHARLAKMREHLPRLGTQVDYVASVHSFRPADDAFFKENIRVNPETEPLGCVGDLGWYNVRFSLFLANYVLPTTARGVFHRMINGVPTHATAELVFPDGMVSNFQCSFHHPTRQWADVCGPEGRLHVHDFVHGGWEEASFEVDTGMTLKPMAAGVQDGPETIRTDDCIQEQAMIETFSSIALGERELDPFWPEVALKTQRVTDAIMRSGRESGSPVEI